MPAVKTGNSAVNEIAAELIETKKQNREMEQKMEQMRKELEENKQGKMEAERYAKEMQ